MQKQIDLENKSLNITSEMIFGKISKHTTATHLESFECNDSEELCSPFDVSLPTSRAQEPKKVLSIYFFSKYTFNTR